LHPFDLNIQLTNNEFDGRDLKIRVQFSIHCFSIDKTTTADPDLDYSDNRETRTFCFNRYGDSFPLKEFIEILLNDYVFHTDRRNFMYLPNGGELFFTLSKADSSVDHDLNFYVQSYYKRTRGNTPKAGKARFRVIVYKVFKNQKISIPAR
jgi:hypothetical protein